MKLTPELLYAYRAGILTNFDEAFRQGASFGNWNLIATQVDTVLPTQDYAFLGNQPAMAEFKDEIRRTALKEGSYTLSDKIYDATLEVKRKELEDDQTGLIRTRIAAIGEEATRHDNELVFTTLFSGFSGLCYDGQYFFDTDHSEGDSGTQSNTTSDSLSDSALEAGHVAMSLFKDERGKPRGIRPDTLVVGPRLERKAMDLLGSGVVVVRVGEGTAGTGATAATGFDNYFRGKYTLVVTEYETGYKWALAQCRRAIKPVVLQKRSDIGVSIEDNMGDPNAMMKERFDFRVRERKAAGFGPWFLAYGSSASS